VLIAKTPPIGFVHIFAMSANHKLTTTAAAAALTLAGALIVWMGRRRQALKKKSERDVSEVLPYFDDLLTNMNDPAFEIAFGRHVHWGYWKDPSTADATSAQNYADAAEALCQCVCDAGGPIVAGEHLLDVGCGFGGTISSLNERFSNLTLTGLNIDERQLERARKKVQAKNQNTITFVQGDACDLRSIEDGSLDMVSAVECIFHFPSRERFFAECRRVLKPGGRLVVCDFVLCGWLDRVVRLFIGDVLKDGLYGDVRVTSSPGYHALAKNAGFRVTSEVDITKQTLPTYPFVKQLQKNGHLFTNFLEWISQRGYVSYIVYRFDRE
jgi:SAM-dependent methyltransferase